MFSLLELMVVVLKELERVLIKLEVTILELLA
jgi:hypothetical protein